MAPSLEERLNTLREVKPIVNALAAKGPLTFQEIHKELALRSSKRARHELVIRLQQLISSGIVLPPQPDDDRQEFRLSANRLQTESQVRQQFAAEQSQQVLTEEQKVPSTPRVREDPTGEAWPTKRVGDLFTYMFGPPPQPSD